MEKYSPLSRVPDAVEVIALLLERLTFEQAIHPPAPLDQVHQAAEIAKESFVSPLVNDAVLDRLGAAPPIRQGRGAQVTLQEFEHVQPISGLLQSQECQQIVMIQTAHRRALQFQQMRLARI